MNLHQYNACHKKGSYEKPASALKIMHSMTKRGQIHKLGFYKCPFCGKYHITSMVGEK